jgi:hypothetical protein
MNVKKIRRLLIVAASLGAILGSLVTAGPADAYAVDVSGKPGATLMYYPGYCEGAGKLDYSAPNYGYYAELETPVLLVTPSRSYSLPQTIVEHTRIDYSTDDGQTWWTWKWIEQSMELRSLSPATLQSQSIFLPQGYSYRIVPVLEFKVGNGSVGWIGISLSRDDYSFQYAGGVNQPFSFSITPTRYSSGCTVRST